MKLKPSHKKELTALYAKYRYEKLPSELPQIISNTFGINISANYFGLGLSNPIMVAPGQLTLSEGQIKRIVDAGYGGLVLKSVVGEDEKGNSSMAEQGFRKKPTYIKTVFDETDAKKERPIIHWDGRLDTRTLDEYLSFAEKALMIGEKAKIPVVGSFLCHLPKKGESWKEEEWIYTAEKFRDLSFKCVEIDFCPTLTGIDTPKNRETVLEWYRKAPRLIKSVKGLKVMPKILNLEFGEHFQLEMVKTSAEGDADGVIIANRMYKPEYASTHGGIELKKRNMKLVKNVRANGLDIPISATGGVYTGKDALDYIEAGAQNVQLLSYILGKWSKPVKVKKEKFELALYEILLNPQHGFVAAMLDLNKNDVSSVRDFYNR